MARKRKSRKRTRPVQADDEFEGLERRPISKWFYVFIGVVAIVALAILLYPQPTEVIPEGSSDPLDLPEEDYEELSWLAEGIPEGRLTSVTLTYNNLYYANEGHRIMFVPLFVGNTFEDSFFFDANEFAVAIDRANSRFSLEDEEGKLLETYSFVPGQASNNSITFGKFDVKYRYYVPRDGNSVYFLLEKQAFGLQFGKNFWFEGTDTDDDGIIDADYFMPDLEIFGGNSFDEHYSVAVLSFDADEDFQPEVKAYVDCTDIWALNPAKVYRSYPYQAELLENGQWKGMSTTGEEISRRTETAQVSIKSLNLEVFLLDE